MLRRHCPSQRRDGVLKKDPFSQEVYDANSDAVRARPMPRLFCTSPVSHVVCRGVTVSRGVVNAHSGCAMDVMGAVWCDLVCGRVVACVVRACGCEADTAPPTVARAHVHSSAATASCPSSARPFCPS